MGPDEAIAAAHVEARLKIQSAVAYLRMAHLAPERFSYKEACERALSELEEVAQVAVLMREVRVEVEVEVPKPHPPKSVKGLSPREAEILTMVAEGMTNAEIGEKLFLSPFTIKSHVARILKCLGVSNRAEAVSVATKRGEL